ncbi:outer membrane protein [Vibrio zhanjiangensis]|uniref:Outer membrane protein n=1 Tax=Vibrio zhanjiangensis TaxID=1046128 RepID=A0ABQ6EZV5_9VIBR|nr:porin [Vibrio zhanjiangensis]GLT18772.1 outer membrane protein [Vibrio zhanjiangensis]
MKIKLLAALVAATACGTNAFAAEVYNSEGTTLSIGGHVSVGVGEYGSDDDVAVEQVSPRLNIAGTQDIGNGLVVDMKSEWAMDYLDGGDRTFSTRLGYIGLTHEEMGRMVVGTQWSPYYDVGGVADMPIAFANDFLYENQARMGGARADRMVSYRKSFALADDGMVNFGLGWQGEHTSIVLKTDARFQVALSAQMMGFGAGYAYSGGEKEFTVANVTQDATSHIFSLNYGSYGAGVYVAAVFGFNEYFYNNYKETTHIEGLLAYGMDNGLNMSVNYEEAYDEAGKYTLYTQSAIQFEYTVAPSFVTFAAYQIDLGDDFSSTEDDDKWIVGMRYYL